LSKLKPKGNLLKQGKPEKQLLRSRQPSERSLKQPRKMFQAVLIFWLLLDVVSKQIVLFTMELRQTIPLWEGVFHLTYVRNYGAAFSMMQGQMLIFYLALLLLLCMVVWFWFSERPNHWMPVVGTALVVAGALGNTLDRAFYGSVVDMFDFRAINFAIFNVADMGITVGGALFIIWLLIPVEKIQLRKILAPLRSATQSEMALATAVVSGVAPELDYDYEFPSSMNLVQRLELRLLEWETDIEYEEELHEVDEQF